MTILYRSGAATEAPDTLTRREIAIAVPRISDVTSILFNDTRCAGRRPGPRTADALLRWHRRLVRWRWTYPRRGGRPPVDAKLAALIEQMARENPGWDTSGSRANCST